MAESRIVMYSPAAAATLFGLLAVRIVPSKPMLRVVATIDPGVEPFNMVMVRGA